MNDKLINERIDYFLSENHILQEIRKSTGVSSLLLYLFAGTAAGGMLASAYKLATSDRPVPKLGADNYNSPSIDSGYGGIIAVGSFTVALLYLAAKFYERQLSAAARKCRGYTRDLKSKCIDKEKIVALNTKIAILTRGLDGCKKTKNPEICKRKIVSKIADLKRIRDEKGHII